MHQAHGQEASTHGPHLQRGVHSSLDHLYKLIEIGKEYNLKDVYVHCFMDGRDTDPKSRQGFIEEVQQVCQANGAPLIASIIGLFFAMDRDQALEPCEGGLRPAREGQGKQAADMVAAMEESYAEGVTDEFIKAINNSTVDGTIKEGDVVIFINFRNDRAKELTQVSPSRTCPRKACTPSRTCSTIA
jgi:2,3-bisphosphoglycerate-independent phosphoglycerate mutase